MIYLQFDSDGAGYSCVVEDDGKVAYAYLLNQSGIVSDLWLYNCAETPSKPEWSDRTKMPFANPIEFANCAAMAPPINTAEDVEVEWRFNGDFTLHSVVLSIRGVPYGRLAPGAKPGWCIAAAKDGPLAKCM